MKLAHFLLSAGILMACNNNDTTITTARDAGQNAVNLPVAVPKRDTAVPVADTATVTPAMETGSAVKKGVHPISLQWISWDKKGEVVVSPLEDGWYSIEGSQFNSDKDHLKIEGKIKRVSEKELEFEGNIETKVSHIYRGEPCIKAGKQIFAAKGNRKYFRLRNMVNCEGGNLVDYVDIYAGTSSL